MVDADVLVVGGGPVGETLLAMLGDRGISAIAFEREAELWPKPRAVHFDGETLRTFQSIGVGDSIYSITSPMLSYRMTNEAGEVLLDVPTGQLGPEGWIEDVMFHQPDVDALLRDAIDGLETVKLLTGHTVERVSQTAEGVAAWVVDAEGIGKEFTGRYLVAADGASSTVRHHLGIGYEELGPNDPWLVVDGLFTEEPSETRSMAFFGEHSRPRLWGALPGMRRRMEFKVLSSDDPKEIVTAEWIDTATRGLMRPDNFEIERTAIYTFRSCLADQWRDGRIFLAGDAVHLAPPLFGQGLCSGIRDAANLAWKLALVLDGADDALLNTYESERKPHVRGWIEQATRLANFVQTTDPQVAEQRDRHIREHPEQGRPQPQRMGTGFRTEQPLAGWRLPQPTISDEYRFDDLVGSRFLLVANESVLATLSDDIRSALNASPQIVVLTETTPGVPQILEFAGAAAVFARPDRYIYGAADSSEELEHLAKQIVTTINNATASSAA